MKKNMFVWLHIHSHINLTLVRVVNIEIQTRVFMCPLFICATFILFFRLCCECGCLIDPNPANMCVACLRNHVDITEGMYLKTKRKINDNNNNNKPQFVYLFRRNSQASCLIFLQKLRKIPTATNRVGTMLPRIARTFVRVSEKVARPERGQIGRCWFHLDGAPFKAYQGQANSSQGGFRWDNAATGVHC